jgi:hypothetical protein
MGKYVTIGKIEVHLGFIVMTFIILLLSTVLALTYYTKTIDHQASITTDGKVQTYLDASCTQLLNSHNWGTFNTSSGDYTESFDLYLKNEGNVAVNVTWIASNFTSYDETDMQFKTSKWTLYLAKIEGSEVKVRPENDTAPDKVHLSSGQVIQLKFYLTALDSSSPEDYAFKTSFNSKDS